MRRFGRAEGFKRRQQHCFANNLVGEGMIAVHAGAPVRNHVCGFDLADDAGDEADGFRRIRQFAVFVGCKPDLGAENFGRG